MANETEGARRTRRRRSGADRLGRADWMRAGQELLCKEGIAGMRLSKLTKKLRVSTGSFYHHFTDMEEYLGALAESFNTDQVETQIAAVEAETSDPLQQIRLLRAQSRDSGIFELDAAMRVWATSDPRAAAAMRRSERVVLSFLADAFGRLGFDAEQSDLRARILLSTNVAHFTEGVPGGPGGFSEQALKLLIADAKI